MFRPFRAKIKKLDHRVSLAISDEVVSAIKLPKKQMEGELIKEIAFTLYDRGLTSMGVARRFAALSKWEFIEGLAERGISRHYYASEVEEDIKAVAEQSQQLQGLKRLLELDGYECYQDEKIPLIIKSNAYQLAIGTYPGLLDKKAENFKHPLCEKDIHLINDYFLDLNLPVAYQKLIQALGVQGNLALRW